MLLLFVYCVTLTCALFSHLLVVSSKVLNLKSIFFSTINTRLNINGYPLLVNIMVLRSFISGNSHGHPAVLTSFQLANCLNYSLAECLLSCHGCTSIFFQCGSHHLGCGSRIFVHK